MKTVMDPRLGPEWLSGVISDSLDSLEAVDTLRLAEARAGSWDCDPRDLPFAETKASY
jgi:hypothetical protein